MIYVIKRLLKNDKKEGTRAKLILLHLVIWFLCIELAVNSAKVNGYNITGIEFNFKGILSLFT